MVWLTTRMTDSLSWEAVSGFLASARALAVPQPVVDALLARYADPVRRRRFAIAVRAVALYQGTRSHVRRHDFPLRRSSVSESTGPDYRSYPSIIPGRRPRAPAAGMGVRTCATSPRCSERAPRGPGGALAGDFLTGCSRAPTRPCPTLRSGATCCAGSARSSRASPPGSSGRPARPRQDLGPLSCRSPPVR
jgi:hypothetical protein